MTFYNYFSYFLPKINLLFLYSTSIILVRFLEVPMIYREMFEKILYSELKKKKWDDIPSGMDNSCIFSRRKPLQFSLWNNLLCAYQKDIRQILVSDLIVVWYFSESDWYHLNNKHSWVLRKILLLYPRPYTYQSNIV